MDTPDFSQPEMVLSGKRPSRPVLFEFFLNDKLYHHLTGKQMENCSTNEENIVVVIEAFRNTGYDYVTLTCRNRNTLKFERGEKHKEESISLIVYEQYSSRISLPGGIDMDFLVSVYPTEIRARAVNLLKRTAAMGDMPWAPVRAFPNTCPLRTILR